MAGVAKVSVNLRVTGLGESIEKNIEDVTLTVPVEHAGNYVVHSTAQTTAIQLSDLAPQIALDKMYMLFIIARAGTIYVQVDTAGTATFAAAAAHHIINEGVPALLPLNPAGNLGVVIDAASITDAFEWLLLGEA